jgi:hypothetical protein
VTHYKKLLDPSVFIGAQDFPEPKTVTISRVVREDMPERSGEAKQAAPMMYFSAGGKELPRRYKVPKSVLYGLSLEMGSDIDLWAGKQITLFAARCMAFGEIEECVRVEFKPETTQKIYTWMKKRKANKSAYMVQT